MTLLLLTATASLLSLCLVAHAASQAPEAHEDGSGFHLHRAPVPAHLEHDQAA